LAGLPDISSFDEIVALARKGASLEKRSGRMIGKCYYNDM